MIMSEHLQNPNNDLPIEQLTIQSAVTHRPVFLGWAALRIATLGVS